MLLLQLLVRLDTAVHDLGALLFELLAGNLRIQ
jgi:hypothetical protein